MWHGTCRTYWFEYFKNSVSSGLSTHNHMAINGMKSENTVVYVIGTLVEAESKTMIT